MNGCPSCVTTGSTGGVRSPPLEKPSQETFLSISAPTLLTCPTVCPSGRYRHTVQGSIMDTGKNTSHHCVDRCVSVLLQPMPARRQSSVHAEAAFPVTCSSQVRVAAWLQSSEDMDRCSKGEGPELSRHWRLSWDSLLCGALLYFYWCLSNRGFLLLLKWNHIKVMN